MPCHCIPHYLSHRQFLVYCLEVEPNGNRGNSLETSVPTQQIDHIIRRLRGFHSFLLLLSHFRPISFSPPSLISGPKTPEDTPIKVEKRRRTQDFVKTPSTVLLANRLRTDTCTEMRFILCSWFGEFCSCCSLTDLPGPAWVLLNWICKELISSLYIF